MGTVSINLLRGAWVSSSTLGVLMCMLGVLVQTPNPKFEGLTPI